LISRRAAFRFGPGTAIATGGLMDDKEPKAIEGAKEPVRFDTSDKKEMWPRQIGLCIGLIVLLLVIAVIVLRPRKSKQTEAPQ
jgi:hypothetical protein